MALAMHSMVVLAAFGATGLVDAVQTYDYIIVGGGATGFVVAKRLTEDYNKTVLIIENGALDNGTRSSIPGNSEGLSPAAMYDIYSAPGLNLGNKSFLVTVCNVVGGGPYVNGMQWDRGSDADYNAWTEVGNEGWDWKGLEPYLAKSTRFDPPSEETTREFGITYDEKAYGNGPLNVSIPDYQFPDMKAIFHSWDNVTFDNSSADVLTATGVKYMPRGSQQQMQAVARKEVILAAGGVFTPHLLMYSGIGPRDVLEAAGISVKRDLAAVGSNFQGYIASYMNFTLQNLAPESLEALNANATFNQTSYEEYVQYKTGPYSTGKSNVLVFMALQHFDPAINGTVSKIRTQNVSELLPERYSKNEALLTGYIKQRDIMVEHYFASDAAVGEITMQF
ncbi:hypothetical protein E8E12_008495 [Didymella heteroderae]|uniref:Glucose-methanol-choline oxidoreductase N-terminal domain-containing protein n=1 Tax=Didymella heteroderae TaxID=1769908 RepID=A0A9P5C4G9_9PLEO|nr:hypothetical protein E8E12_008495 [Didymella heteroderae]